MAARVVLPALVALFVALPLLADGPQDNNPAKVRRVPAAGVPIGPEILAEIQNTIDQLGQQIAKLEEMAAANPGIQALLPDVQIFHNAARYAVRHDEFFDPKEAETAKKLLKLGLERAAQLKAGRPEWTAQTGLVVRGYRSKIDDSIQPYGLVVPESYKPGNKTPMRLDFWCHGRDERLTELRFLDARLKSRGEFTPPGALVLHLYGRYCNANKFAGDIDLLEAFDQVRKQYPIDEDRVVIRGFSMGGAACWQFAVHYPGMWAAAAPGAGFAETPEFLEFFQKEKVTPTWYEAKLWHLYNATDYAVNLFNCPTIAYSGEVDSQKQAADVMAREMKKEGIDLVHLIGPKTGHKYHPDTKAELNRLIDEIVAKGRDPLPERIRFTTWTLAYNRSHWIQVDALTQHWTRARVEAVRGDPRADVPAIKLVTENVEGLTIDMPAGRSPYGKNGKSVPLVVDGTSVVAPPPEEGRPWVVHLAKRDGAWQVVRSTDSAGLAKRHGLQGPIDDAYLDRFVMVRPTGKSANEQIARWYSSEMAHAIEHWRRHFRGEALIKDDGDIGAADIASSNLVLWGDPASNKVLAKIAAKLPIQWNEREIVVGGKKYSAANHAPVLVFPNPLNPKKYIVLNSGFTFREYDYLNNARQVPRLPDFAIINVDTPAGTQYPGAVVDAGFFSERWTLP